MNKKQDRKRSEKKKEVLEKKNNWKKEKKMTTPKDIQWTRLASTKELPNQYDKLVIYDGVCQLCDTTVKFLISNDPKKIFRFVALQSKAAIPVLDAFGVSRKEALTSILFIDNHVAYRKSAAALQIAQYLPAPYSWIATCSCVPSFFRDIVYDFISANRYRIFGEIEEGTSCMRPTQDIKSRFLDADELSGPRVKKDN